MKGFLPEKDVFEGLEAEITPGLKLHSVLRRRAIDTMYVAGLATDYCVRGTVLDALEKGYKVNVVTDAIRAVDLEPGDGERALREMCAAGAEPVTASDLLARIPLKQGAENI
jgi:nicotinamidase/pyrazinamidase